MNWPEYPKYYNSGLPWIGPIPSHWSLVPNRAFLELKRRPVGSQSGTFTLLSLTLRGVIQRDISENKGKFPAAFDTYQEVDTGDLVFCLFDIEETPRTVGLSPHRGMITGAYDVFRVSSHVNARYIEYLYLSLDQRKSLSYFYSGLRKVIRMPTFNGIRSPLPPLDEQHQIASFLDGETAKIDALIDKQEQLITTLREDRAATITQAVTRGLAPEVEMRNAETKWIESVPSHWDVVPIKRLATTITDGAHISPETDGGVYDFVSTKDVDDRGINFEGSLKTSPSSYEYLVRNGCQPEPGDVLFSKDGTIGRTVVVAERRSFVIASSLIIIRPDAHRVDSRFVHFLCQAVNVREQVESFVKGAGLPRLSISNLRKIVVPLPPLEEQAAITAILEAHLAKVDSLIRKSTESIDTLREYRSALITNAVTGKIDVREAV